jgi:hypothetical protein
MQLSEYLIYVLKYKAKEYDYNYELSVEWLVESFFLHGLVTHWPALHQN